ncbi:MAG: hypothetical protein QOF91_2547 [Alphaproteobacteria bacterium]|jgi:hypothetical protein|nr:hypothetical protein [Alphaproteobacteria bacterium]MEA3027262.1 hypothetical protein [Alphaproteobacteria bacterium]
MRTVFFGLIAVGLTACGTNTTTDSTGWSWYDGTPVKGNAALEQKFRSDDGMCQGRDMSVYKFCMSSRGYAEGLPPPAVAAVAPIAPTDWRARAAEARAAATQIADPVARKMMTQIAESYERLAGYSEGRPTARKSASNR